MYFTKSLPSLPKEIHIISLSWSTTKRIVFTAIMASIAMILQSAGGVLPGIGYLISPFATAPILFCMLLSSRSGILSYLLTICLLFIFQPSELLVFPFTTGLIGLSFGWTFRFFNRRYEIIFINGITLLVGICILLYGLHFPAFGPSLSTSFNLISLVILFVFSFIYSWLWLGLGMFLLRRLKATLLFPK